MCKPFAGSSSATPSTEPSCPRRRSPHETPTASVSEEQLGNGTSPQLESCMTASASGTSSRTVCSACRSYIYVQRDPEEMRERRNVCSTWHQAPPAPIRLCQANEICGTRAALRPLIEGCPTPSNRMRAITTRKRTSSRHRYNLGKETCMHLCETTNL